MEKDLKKLVLWIKDNYSKLPESTINDKKLVIFSTGNFSGEYGYGSSDLQSWGVDKEGKLLWAYASGCSCNCGADTEEKTFKIFELSDTGINSTNISKAIGLFKSNKEEFTKSLCSYEYKSY